MSFYVKQYYEQAVETHDHAAVSYYTHDSPAKDDLNNATGQTSCFTSKFWNQFISGVSEWLCMV